MGLLDKIKGMVNTDDEYGDNYGLDETENDDIIPTRSAASRPGMNISGHDNSVAIELKVVRPESYSSVTEIADHLLNHRTVVLNLEATNREVAKRLIRFSRGSRLFHRRAAQKCSQQYIHHHALQRGCGGFPNQSSGTETSGDHAAARPRRQSDKRYPVLITETNRTLRRGIFVPSRFCTGSRQTL